MRMVTQTTAIIVVLLLLVLTLAGSPQVNTMKKDNVTSKPSNYVNREI